MLQQYKMKSSLLYSDSGRRWIDLRAAATIFQETPESLVQKYIMLYTEAKVPIYSRRKQAMWRASIGEILLMQDEVEVPVSWVHSILEAQ